MRLRISHADTVNYMTVRYSLVHIMGKILFLFLVLSQRERERGGGGGGVNIPIIAYCSRRRLHSSKNRKVQEQTHRKGTTINIY